MVLINEQLLRQSSKFVYIRQIEWRVWREKIRERNVSRSFRWKDQNWKEREEIEIVPHAESGIHFDIISPS